MELMQKFFIIAGPSGVGKDTLLQRIMADMPELTLARSLTTRPLRPLDAVIGKFQQVTTEQFQEAIHRGKLLEWNKYSGYLYGTLWPKDTQSLIGVIDLNGINQLRESGLMIQAIFIVPPRKTIDEQMSSLQERLEKRGSNSKGEIRKRLTRARQEIVEAPDIVDHIVINDDLDKAVEECEEIIRARL